MARPRDFLARFRPLGTPGAAAAAGVPADRVAELAAELGPLLANLDDAQAEAARIREAGHRDAAARRASGRAAAEAAVAKASDQAQSDRLARLAAARLEADQLVAEGVEAARREAADIGVRAEQRLPQLLDRVLQDVRADVFDPRTGPGRP